MATALARYALLETTGQWFDGASARPREVIVKFGETTLMLLDGSGRPLAHWALAALRAQADLAGRGELVLAPEGDSEERLQIADPDMCAAIRAVCPALHARRAATGALRRLALWGGGAVAAVLIIVFVLIPAIAGELAVLIPPAREEALGRAVLDQAEIALAGFGPAPRTCRGEAGLAALDRMMARLGPQIRAHVPVRVRVLDHPMVNAFAVPGGHVVLMRGLLEAAESPEEVAAILAHEVGHVAHRDPTRLVLRAAGSAGLLGLLLGDITGGAAITIVAEQVVSASYTRDAEAAADAEAHRIMTGADLPLEPLAGFFERLAAGQGQREGILSHLATHPDLASRARAAREADRARADAPFVPVIEDQDWVALRNICDR